MDERADTSVDRGLVLDASAFDAAIFDLDGVVTRTATLHAASWRKLFDDFLGRRAHATGEAFRPFDVERDYREYVDGRPRLDGIRSFLGSRGITLPEGRPDDAQDRETVFGFGARKNALFREALAQSGVEVFESSVAFIKRLRGAGLKTAAVSSSENAAPVLDAAGLADLFDIKVDGLEAERLSLRGKPAPDAFRHAAQVLGVDAARAVGVEDALAGVEAIRAAGYGLVVGVDRSGQEAALRRHGADLVVKDLAELQITSAAADMHRRRPNGAAASWSDLPAAPTAETEWLIVDEGFTLTQEHELESIFAVGNGHLGSRGSLAEGSTMSAPATFVAGLFDPQPGPTPALAILPDWARISMTIEDQPLRLDSGRTLEHRRLLDLRQGILWREWRHEDSAGRITRLRGLRLASLADRRLLIQSIVVTAENYSGRASMDAPLDEVVTRRLGNGVTVAFATSSALREVGGRTAGFERSCPGPRRGSAGGVRRRGGHVPPRCDERAELG